MMYVLSGLESTLWEVRLSQGYTCVETRYCGTYTGHYNLYDRLTNYKDEWIEFESETGLLRSIRVSDIIHICQVDKKNAQMNYDDWLAAMNKES